jgi:hypothetical protein
MNEKRVKGIGCAFILCMLLLLHLIVSQVWAETTIFKNENGNAVMNRPTSPTQFTLAEPTTITYVHTYHWNNGRGAPAGLITITNSSGKTVYSGQSAISSKYYWYVRPNLIFPGGTYTIGVSAPDTWSYNGTSAGKGFAMVNGETIPGDEKGKVNLYYGGPADMDSKGPVSLSGLLAAVKPSMVPAKTSLRVGEEVEVKVYNVPAGKGVGFSMQSRVLGYTHTACNNPKGTYTSGQACKEFVIRIKGIAPGVSPFQVNLGADIIGPITITVQP